MRACEIGENHFEQYFFYCNSSKAATCKVYHFGILLLGMWQMSIQNVLVISFSFLNFLSAFQPYSGMLAASGLRRLP